MSRLFASVGASLQAAFFNEALPDRRNMRLAVGRRGKSQITFPQMAIAGTSEASDPAGGS
jgi:hypothetical protein